MAYKNPPKEYQFKPGNPGRPKGSKNYSTLFREAMIAIATRLELGEEPDQIWVKLFQKGLEHALKGNYSFYKDIVDREFGPVKQQTDVNINMQEFEKKAKEFFEHLNDSSTN